MTVLDYLGFVAIAVGIVCVVLLLWMDGIDGLFEPEESEVIE